jgi:hypothetical protein
MKAGLSSFDYSIIFVALFILIMLLLYNACASDIICKPKIIIPEVNTSECRLNIRAKKIRGIPCGAIATQAVLKYYGIEKDFEFLKRRIAGSGYSYARVMCEYFDQLNFKSECSWNNNISYLRHVVCEEHVPALALIIVEGKPWTSSPVSLIPGFNNRHIVTITGMNDTHIFFTDAFGDIVFTIERFEDLWTRFSDYYTRGLIIPRPK